jgi:hypothetical protein
MVRRLNEHCDHWFDENWTIVFASGLTSSFCVDWEVDWEVDMGCFIYVPQTKLNAAKSIN